MTTDDRFAPLRVVAALVVHVFLWGALLATLVIAGPRFDAMFRDYQMKLPVLTEAVVTLSRLAGAYLPVTIAVWFLILAVDATVLILTAMRRETVILGRIWTVGMTLVPLFGLLLVWGGLLLTWI